MESVSFRYPTAAHQAVADVSLRVDPGEVVALVGPNGSGKTTVAKLLAGLYLPDTGRVVWSGVDTRDLDPALVRDEIAIGFQDFERFRMSVFDNIAVGRHSRRTDSECVISAAARAGASELAAALPGGFDTLLGPEFSGGYDLSQGQWQRVALGRVLFRDAALLILDEPTAALDALAEFELFEKMREALDGRSTVLISHRLSSVRMADRIYVLQHGRVSESGSHAQLMALNGLYARLFTTQASAYMPSPPEPAGVVRAQKSAGLVSFSTLRDAVSRVSSE